MEDIRDITAKLVKFCIALDVLRGIVEDDQHRKKHEETLLYLAGRVVELEILSEEWGIANEEAEG